MYVIRENYNTIVTVPIETSLAEKRMVFVEGEINQMAADEFAKQIMFLAFEDSDAPIKVIINSEGGEIEAGLKMCDAVEGCPCRVDAYCYTRAYSMAAVLFESVNGNRYMVGNGKLMLHQPSITGTGRKTAGEIEELSLRLKETNDRVLSIVSKKSGISLAKLKKETEKDRFYDADEAVKTGLADQAVSFGDMLLG